ncbi:MAG: DUF1002 domain-containing protein [Chloroflexota bacterium]
MSVNRVIAVIVIITLTALAVCSWFIGARPALAEGTKVVVLGSDLTAEQQEAMKRQLGAQSGVRLISVSNAEERAYLGQYVPAEMIGQRAISSASVETLPAGSGITVQITNISWVTPEMYASALVTAGVKDARVVAAAPMPVSGTAALAGIVKAFESATGAGLATAAKNAAANELYQTGKLGEQIGDKNRATRFIIMTKQRVTQANTKDPGQIRTIIRDVAKQNNITLTDAQVTQLADLMAQIKSLNLNVSQLTSQLQSVRAQLDKVLGSLAETRSWIQRLIDAIRDLIARIAAIFQARTTAALRALRIIR